MYPAAMPNQIPSLINDTSPMLAVLKLFIIPVGGGIPAGVMLAQANGLAWPITTVLYLISDVLLALAFEPFLRLVAALFARVPCLARLTAALKAASARTAAHFSGAGAGPVSLLLISFGVDPMTGRTAALAEGYGWLGGWTFAIAGDMLYFAVIAVTTLRLNSYIRDPNTTMLIVLGAMMTIPVLLRRFRGQSAI